MHGMVLLTPALLDVIRARAQGFGMVSTARVQIGVLSHIGSGATAFCFDAVSRGAIAEGVRLEIERPSGLRRHQNRGAANEGKLVAICWAAKYGRVLDAMRTHRLHFVQMGTRFGGKQFVDWLSGEQLPRIC